ncbi:unnamed protein product, partial [Ectocarpus sp. 12 AP-2014]
MGSGRRGTLPVTGGTSTVAAGTLLSVSAREMRSSMSMAFPWPAPAAPAWSGDVASLEGAGLGGTSAAAGGLPSPVRGLAPGVLVPGGVDGGGNMEPLVRSPGSKLFDSSTPPDMVVAHESWYQ